ncbi:MAG: FecR domain-containing protein [Xenococcaceae cyanobacterium]
MSRPKKVLSQYKLITILCLTISFISKTNSSVLAQSVLESAEIYKLRNQVELSRRNRPVWNPAKLGDNLAPQDAIRTGANSRAELLFNEGTLVRTGAGTIFRFSPGKRNFELDSGSALVLIRPDRGESVINTPEATISSQGTALLVQHDPQANSSLVGVLTSGGTAPVKVTSADGTVTIELSPGEFVAIINGIVGLVEHFILPMFYENVELASGLGTSQATLMERESPEVQKTLELVRAEALEPLQNQAAWLKGFCRLNINPDQLAPLLQWLGLGVPGEQILLKLPERDLYVTPMRSLTGLAWLSNYCQMKNEP